jgi:hypothetical protein
MRVRDCPECAGGVSECLPPQCGGNVTPRNGKRLVVKGFISYTHTDYKLFQRFEAHLALSKDHGGADFWADKRILAGEHWSPAIERAIDQSEIFLLLISAKFFGSAYIWNEELPRIMARSALCGGLIVPVILRPCRWEFKLGGYQAVPTVDGNLKPISEWRPHDKGCHAAHDQVLAAVLARTARMTGGTP